MDFFWIFFFFSWCVRFGGGGCGVWGWGGRAASFDVFVCLRKTCLLLTPSLPTTFAFFGGGAVSFQDQSLVAVKLAKMSAFEMVLPKNSREAGIQAGSRTASYNQTEGTLSMTSYDILKAEKGLILLRVIAFYSAIFCALERSQCDFTDILLLFLFVFSVCRVFVVFPTIHQTCHGV